MSACVLDCSVVADLLVGAEGPALVAPVRHHDWVAPEHLGVEFVSALRGLVLGGHLTRARAREAVADFADLDICTWPLERPALERTLQLGGSMTAYDAAYVVCAEAFDCPLVTRDRRLARSARRHVEVLVR